MLHSLLFCLRRLQTGIFADVRAPFPHACTWMSSPCRHTSGNCRMTGVKLSCDNRITYRNLYQSVDHSVHHVLVAMASGVSKLRVSVNEQRLVHRCRIVSCARVMTSLTRLSPTRVSDFEHMSKHENNQISRKSESQKSTQSPG